MLDTFLTGVTVALMAYMLWWTVAMCPSGGGCVNDDNDR